MTTREGSTLPKTYPTLNNPLHLGSILMVEWIICVGTWRCLKNANKNAEILWISAFSG